MEAFNELVESTVDWFEMTLKSAYLEEEVIIINGERSLPATLIMQRWKSCGL
jgi:hypothetical protein